MLDPIIAETLMAVSDIEFCELVQNELRRRNRYGVLYFFDAAAKEVDLETAALTIGFAVAHPTSMKDLSTSKMVSIFLRHAQVYLAEAERQTGESDGRERSA